MPPAVADHLARLLAAEGVAAAELPEHPDWRLWLWSCARAGAGLAAAAAR